MPIPPCASEGYVTQGQYKAERFPGQAYRDKDVDRRSFRDVVGECHCDERSEEAIPTSDRVGDCFASPAVTAYEGERDPWFSEWFQPTLARIDV
jgi:hypothetical protein